MAVSGFRSLPSLAPPKILSKSKLEVEIKGGGGSHRAFPTVTSE